MHSAVVLAPVGRGRRTATPEWMSMRMGDTALAPRELQQQPSIGAQQGGSRAPAITETRTAAVSPQAGRGRRTTTSAWISTGTRGPALSTRGLQHQEPISEQNEGVLPPTTAAAHPAAVPLSMGRGRQTHGCVRGRGKQRIHQGDYNNCRLGHGRRRIGHLR